jgi:hypothetical protein
MKDSLTVSRSGENLSVNASHCHLPYRGEALAFRKASPFRQRLPSVGELSPKVTERARTLPSVRPAREGGRSTTYYENMNKNSKKPYRSRFRSAIIFYACYKNLK